MSSKIQIAKICNQCASRFIAKTTVTRFCSKACNSRFYETTARNAKLLEANIDTITKQTEIKTSQIERHYLNVKGVADLLGVSKRSVYGMINSGRLRALNLSVRSTRVSRIDLEVFFFNNGIKSNWINIVEPIAGTKKSRLQKPFQGTAVQRFSEPVLPVRLDHFLTLRFKTEQPGLACRHPVQ